VSNSRLNPESNYLPKSEFESHALKQLPPLTFLLAKSKMRTPFKYPEGNVSAYFYSSN